jgi:hypothetical protein
MVTVTKRNSKRNPTQELLKTRLDSMRLKPMPSSSSLSVSTSANRTAHPAKQPLRRSATLTMATSAHAAFFVQPKNRSLSLCSLTSNEDDDTDEEIELFERDQHSDAATPEQPEFPPLIPHPSLRFRPSFGSLLDLDNIPRPRLKMRTSFGMWLDDSCGYEISTTAVPTVSPTSSSSSPAEVTCLNNADTRRLPFVPDYEDDDLSVCEPPVDEMIFSTPKSNSSSCSLSNHNYGLRRRQQVRTPLLSPPLLLKPTHSIIHFDDFDATMIATKNCLYLPDVF